MSVRRIFAIALLGTCCLAQELTVAAASDLQAALPEVAQAYEKKTGKKVRLTFGSSGTFFAQIQNGAPFDLFFSADVSYPQRLEAAGLIKPGSLYRYATGKIVLWVPDGSKLDVQRRGLDVLTDLSVTRIAIANPAHAPYGRAAQAALEKTKLWVRVKDKVVLGENISQAAQFVQSGNAQAGIIALSLALSPKLSGGHYWVVPQELYPQLEQAAVIIRTSKMATDAEAFLEFLRSDVAMAILSKSGFELPTPRMKDTP